jgi:hypothetical protein
MSYPRYLLAKLRHRHCHLERDLRLHRHLADYSSTEVILNDFDRTR